MRNLVPLAQALVVVAAAVCPFAELVAQVQPGGGSAKAANEAASVARVNKLWEQFNAAYLRDELAQADQVIGEIVALNRERYGKLHDGTVAALDFLALVKVHLGDQAGAQAAIDEEIASLSAVYGPEHWRTRSAQAREKLLSKLGQLSDADRKTVRGTNKITSDAVALVNKKELAKAIPLYEAALATRRELLGNEHLLIATTLRELGTYAFTAGNRERGEAALVESVAIFTRLLGAEHPETAFSQSQLALAAHHFHRYDEAQRLLLAVLAVRKKVVGPEHEWTLVTMENLAALYDDMDQDEKAATLREQLLAIQRRTLGEEHRNTAWTMNHLANSYSALDKDRQAEELYLRCLEIRRKTLGREHADTLYVMADLAKHYSGVGNFAAAEPLRTEIVTTNQKKYGAEHARTAWALHYSGELQNNLGHYATAVEQLERAVAIRKKLLGAESVDTLASLRVLAGAHGNLGQMAIQERLLVACLAAYRKLYGEDSLLTSGVMRDLGLVYNRNQQYEKADEMLTKSLAVVRKLEREPAAETVLGLLILGGNDLLLGKYSRAETNLRESIAGCRTWLGPENSFVGLIEMFLATAYQMQGKLPEAEDIYRRSITGAERMLGKEHPVVTRMRWLLSMALFQQDKPEEAFAELRTVLSRTEREFVELGNVLGDDESVALAAEFRSFLETAVEFTATDDRYLEEVFGHVARFKGQVLARQRLLRAVADSPEIREVWKDLERAAAELATHSRIQPPADDAAAWQAKLEQLTAQVSQATAQLSQSSAKFRSARTAVSVADIKAALPADAALVDFAEYNFVELPPPGVEKRYSPELRLAAFIVRRDQPIQFVALGPVRPLATAIDAWRSDFGGQSPAGLKAAQELREKLWLPLEERLAGAKTVLVSPQGALARLPFAALPGKAPGSYLIEDWTITLIPSAQAIPELLRENQGASRTDGNLLLVGGVDYEARPGTKAAELPSAFQDFQSFAARGAAKLEFPPLAGARDEVIVIERSYADLIDRQRRGMTLLEGAAASKVAFRHEAPRHAYLHVATHGFFAPPEIKSALDRPANSQVQMLGEFVTKQSIAGFRPGLLSGLALAGASRPAGEGADGILTAQEVSTLDLRGVKLVVLSACETGLGESAGGEGLLGLQRSFQAAGARSVIATLWKVDDVVTRDLMKRFYENLWRRRLSKIEALREAQLWLLRERGPRGLVAVEEQVQRTNRLPPYYWAAFTLSGDWR